MFRFEHTEYLLGLVGLLLLGALLYLLLRWKKKTLSRIGDPILVKQLVRNFSPPRFLVKALLVILAFAAVVIGAANPQKPGATEKVNRQGVDVMLVLDVSKSMLARDIKPSRLDRAKQLLFMLVDKLENDRIGLVLFAGRPYLQMPLTTDHGAAHMYIQDAGPDVVPTQGTVIGEALKMANSSFNEKERKYKAIVLISDGEDHDPEALAVAKHLAENGVMINTVGIGSPEGSPIVDPATNELKKDEQGQTVISKLNEAELQQLSDVTNGRYIRLDNTEDALITLTEQLDSIEKKALSDAEFINYKSYFQWLLGFALLLLLIEFFLSEKRGETATREPANLKSKAAGREPRTTNRDPRAASGTPQPASQLAASAGKLLIFGILLTAASSGATAQNENTLIRSGNRYYKQGQMDKSQKEYQEAVRQAPDNPAANYNLGNTEFRKKNFEEAAKSYGTSVDHSPDSAMREKGLYNKGVALIKQQKLQESIDAWKNALRIDPSDQDARENLQKALLELKKQQSQQKKDQKNQKDKKDQKDQKDQKKDQDQQKQDQQQQPKPQPSRLNKQQVEQLLKALQQRENEVQEKLNQNKVKSVTQPDKDW
jgi:LPXTG-motif cell wall-anchored protein